MSTRSGRVWRDRLTQPRWEEGWIRQWQHAIFPIAYERDLNAASGHRINIELDEALDLVASFNHRVRHVDGGPLVTEAQAEKGRQWLHRYAKRLGLTGPLPNVGPALPPPDMLAIDHFRFRDVVVIETTRWRIQTAPQYRAVWLDGTTLTYYARPWQSGTEIDYRWEAA